MAAIEAIGGAVGPPRRPMCDALMARPSVSVKLSAIHPRFDPGKEARLDAELLPRIVELAAAARRHGLGLTIDAEEQDRLDHDARPVRRRVPRSRARRLAGARPRRAGLRQARDAGAAVARAARRRRGPSASPCGSSRAPTGTARSSGRRSAGSPTIPCSRARRTRTCPISPACGSCWRTRRRSSRSSPPTTPSRSPPSTWRRAAAPTSSSACTAWARRSTRRWSARASSDVPCRIYAPVGPHEDLVAYLVRRLLENGANTSFVNRLADEAAPLEDIIRDPVESVAQERGRPVRLLPRPPDIYLPERAQQRRAGAQRAGGARAAAARRSRPSSMRRSLPPRRSSTARRSAAATRRSWC